MLQYRNGTKVGLVYIAEVSLPFLRTRILSAQGIYTVQKYPTQVINRYRALKCICMAFSPLHQLTLIRRSNIITPEENNPTVHTDSEGVNMREPHFHSQPGPSYSMKTYVDNPSVSSSWFQVFLFTYILV